MTKDFINLIKRNQDEKIKFIWKFTPEYHFQAIGASLPVTGHIPRKVMIRLKWNWRWQNDTDYLFLLQFELAPNNAINGWSQERRGEARLGRLWHDFLDERVSEWFISSPLFYNSKQPSPTVFVSQQLLIAHDPAWLRTLKIILIGLNIPLHVDFKWATLF